MRDSVPKVMLAAVAAALLQLALCAARPAGAGTVFKPISVVHGDLRLLPVHTALGEGVLTVSRLDGRPTGLYYDLGARAGELRPAAKFVVMLGLGGGEMLRAARRTLPKANLVGFDNDRRMLQAATDEFRIGDFGAAAVFADAFVEVKRLRDVDVLLVDIFDGDRMPKPMLELPFWQDCARAIGARGLVVVNVYPATNAAPVEKLLEAARLRVIERHAPAGTGGVLFAEPRGGSL